MLPKIINNRPKHQMAFEPVIHSEMERRLILDQIRYKKPITMIQQFFEYYMQMRPQAPIRITDNYPLGWYAEVVAEDKVWTVDCYKGELRLIKVADLAGYGANGQPIVTNEEDISDNNAHEYYQQCHYAGSPDSIFCVDICNDDDGDLNCTYCPWNKKSLTDKRTWEYKYAVHS